LVTSGPAPSGPPEVVAAQASVEAARVTLEVELDGLTTAARSALDIKAKVRREPVKTAALAGGAGFILLGGPRRVLRAVGSRLFRRRRSYDGLLPDEIERILRDTGAADQPGVREAIAADFADYLQGKKKAGPPPGPATAFWRTYEAMAGPLGRATAWILVRRLLAVSARRQQPDEQVGNGG
jgi:hypothetical protein